MPPPHLQHRVERPRHDQIKGVSKEFGYVLGTRILYTAKEDGRARLGRA